jgi:hypothetical protein
METERRQSNLRICGDEVHDTEQMIEPSEYPINFFFRRVTREMLFEIVQLNDAELGNVGCHCDVALYAFGTCSHCIDRSLATIDLQPRDLSTFARRLLGCRAPKRHNIASNSSWFWRHISLSSGIVRRSLSLAFAQFRASGQNFQIFTSKRFMQTLANSQASAFSLVRDRLRFNV